MLNPNLVLAAIVTVVLIGVGGFVAIVLAGGTDSSILARAGLITALLAAPLTSLISILNSNQTQRKLNGHIEVSDEEREAMEARIAYLENKEQP